MSNGQIYDVIIIGGGITGAGVARDCAMRGLKTLLLEKGRPGMATTVASTHMIHGGLRYLLYDRLTTHATCWDSGHILRIAGPLLTRLPIIWPVYQGHSHGLETVETLLEVYDGFQRMKGGKSHLRLSAAETLKVMPGLKGDGLAGSVSFDEWWVDPVALVGKNLESARRYGAQIQEGHSVDGFLKNGSRIEGVRIGNTELRSRLVINASGPWVGHIGGMAGVQIPLRLRKGTHLIYRKRLVPVGMLLEATDRGRYIFVVPSEQGTLVGPTDLDAPDNPGEIRSEPSEIEYILASVRRYLPDFPKEYDATIVGARPILGQSGNEKLLSREFEVFDHEVKEGVSGLLTIAGGKMSDFRMMAEAVTTAACVKLGNNESCRTYRETLEGKPVEKIPKFALPAPALQAYLKNNPRLRQVYALFFLATAFFRHFCRRLFTAKRPADAQELRNYYS